MKQQVQHTIERSYGTSQTYTLGLGGSFRPFVLNLGERQAQALVIPLHSCGTGPFVRALATLRKLRGYENGWAGPRTCAADKVSFKLAVDFIELLAAREHSSISIEPTIFAEGTAVLEISRGDTKVNLEFTGDGTIAANIDKGNSELDLDILDFDGKVFPDALVPFF